MIEDIFKTAVPYIFAALGALFTELSGALNIALEGQILSSAFWSLTVYNITGSIVAATGAGILASLIHAMLAAFFAFKLRANVFIAGLGANLLAAGSVSLFSSAFFGSSGVIRATGSIEEHTSLFFAAALIAVPLVWFLINQTSFGLRCRAAGISHIALYQKGINPFKYRYLAFALSGVLCGLAGTVLVVRIGAFVPNISAGRGWIALAAVFFGFKKVKWVFLSCLFFAAIEIFASRLQGIPGVPAAAVLALPYIVTLIVLVICSSKNSHSST